jgi:cell division protein ZapA
VSRAPATVSVRILDKEYQVACDPDEVDELTASARYLDGQMRIIRESGKVLGLDRMAVMAALNIAHEFLRLRTERDTSSKDTDRKLTDLLGRVTHALADAKQLTS